MIICRNLIAAMLAAALLAPPARAFDESRFPDWKGQWIGGWTERFPGVTGQPSYDPHKSEGRGQQAPLTPEYQAILEASLADQAAGGPGNDPQVRCLPSGMPRMMIAYWPMEIVITPDTTHLLMEHIHNFRRVYTDGRDWPDDIIPSFAGYSIGRWIDRKGSGRYDMLEVETRGLKGPRVFDSTGLPLHQDNQTIVKERIFADPSDPDMLYDEITTIDHALTRPWSALKNYRRSKAAHPRWQEFVCGEANPWLTIGKDTYYLSGDGYLMPTRKGQSPPDTHYFAPSGK
jgi:hypothetical protein